MVSVDSMVQLVIVLMMNITLRYQLGVVIQKSRWKSSMKYSLPFTTWQRMFTLLLIGPLIWKETLMYSWCAST